MSGLLTKMNATKSITPEAVKDVIRNRNAEQLEQMLAQGLAPDIQLDEKHTALLFTIHQSQPELTALLLKHGANTNYPGQSSYLPLQTAALEDDIRIVKLLLEYGANPNLYIAPQYPALYLATFNGNDSMVSLLLEHDAQPNVGTIEGFTALSLAATKGYTNIMVMLLKAGAELHLTNENGHTALTLATRAGHADAVKILLRYALLRGDFQSFLDHQDQLGQTALMHAIAKGRYTIAVDLLSAQADFCHLKDQDGVSAEQMLERKHLIAPGRKRQHQVKKQLRLSTFGDFEYWYRRELIAALNQLSET